MNGDFEEGQGCQSFVDKIYQNGGKYTKLSINQLPNCHKMYQMAEVYS
jgi:hypothetical protein